MNMLLIYFGRGFEVETFHRSIVNKVLDQLYFCFADVIKIGLFGIKSSNESVDSPVGSAFPPMIRSRKTGFNVECFQSHCQRLKSQAPELFQLN